MPARATAAQRKPRSKTPREAACAARDPAPSAAPASGNGVVPWLTVRGARHNNLKNIDVAFPLGRFTCVTGVSGSGKSSLVNDILYAALARRLNKATTLEPGDHDAIEGLEHLDKVIAIDQSPIGRTPRSNPATYIKVFDEIRLLFARLPDAKLRGYKPGRFSFNVAVRKGGGRCEACEGNGANRIEMDFLADVWVRCPVCEGHRFGHETRQIKFKNHGIDAVLDLEVGDALELFENHPRIANMLKTLHDVGLDYIRLGQSSTTLSGGEAQRIKLARELVKRATGRTLYVLDEPTTGLHFEDVRKLLEVLHGFVDAGNTVVVIEHNLDVLKTADWIIDLGPEGGEGGGRVVAAGTPEAVADIPESYTGQALRGVLGGSDGGSGANGEPRGARRGAPGAGGTAAPFDTQSVTVRGAREHNLKDVTLAFPRNRMTVCTGVSGSGKTSFAIDTVFSEGYRRYVESLSAYARQFLGQLAKPRVDHVEGLSPAICIEQRSASRTPRSTVGTVTEIYDYMRVLWARAGQRFCPRCQEPIGSQTVDEIVARVMAVGEGTPIILLAPVALGDGESYAGLFNRLKASGYTRVRIDGQVRPTAEATTLDARRKHRVEVVVDRTVVRARARSRISESVEHALGLGNGVMTLMVEPVELVADESAEATSASSAAPSEPVGAPSETLFSQRLACLRCGTSYEELGPNHFSFNHQLGWCETCEGLGVQRGAPAGEIIKRPKRSLFDGAIAGWHRIEPSSAMGRLLQGVCKHLGVSPDRPLSEWSDAQRQALLFGASDWITGGDALAGHEELRFRWRGFFPTLDHATRNSWSFRHRLRNLVTDIPCVSCRGGRLRSDAAAVRLGGRTIVEVCMLPLDEALRFFQAIRLDARERQIAGELLKEIMNRLQFLIDVGLEYLTLHRAGPTLSGGEAQRIRLASQIGSGLTGVLYVLDEPTIGLHPRDTRRLVTALAKLRDLGNTLLLVEHDRDVIRSADRVIDFGPRAGAQGGNVLVNAPPAELLAPAPGEVSAAPASVEPHSGADSLTRRYLSGELAIPVPSNRRSVSRDTALAIIREATPQRGSAGPTTASSGHDGPELVLDDEEAARRRTEAGAGTRPRRGSRRQPHREGWLIVRGARQNNLKNLTVPVPLGRLVCVTGVSGSGKSSLVGDILWPALANAFHGASLSVGEHDGIDGLDQLDQVVNVDQSPIGTTPASNPATYTGVFDLIRELYARLPDSRMRGYTANRFSFNRPGGRCEACEGQGQRRIEMHFMPDVWVECETCKGRRYNPETLEVRFKGRNIADVLELRVAEALELFSGVPKVRRSLKTLAEIGLDYVQLGQPAPTLSGGEAQRVKLAAELGRPETGRALYLLDEPTTGLHFDDVGKLLAILQRLVDLGNTVLVVEHNLDVIKCADWIIELGPEAGAAGGHLVALGTPEELAGGDAVAGAGAGPSPTAVVLAPILAASPYAERAVVSATALAAEELSAANSGLGDVGGGTRPPWQVDGRKWHLEQRRSRDDAPRKWEPGALLYVLDLVEREGAALARRIRWPASNFFLPVKWDDRATVEVTTRDGRVWFLHALTGGEWLLELYFRVPPGTFSGPTLDAALGLKTLDERTDLETYGDWPRVDVRPRRGGWDAVVIYAHDRKELDTPAFRRFIRDAVIAYASGHGHRCGTSE